jgi:FtsP/CotA-like multicopper oxidase with cupredoxin domain
MKTPEPDGKFELNVMMMPDEGQAFNRWMVNGQMWPKVDPYIVKAGKRYRFAFRNGMEDSHPVHLHRHSFEVVSVGGKPTAGIIKDTITSRATRLWKWILWRRIRGPRYCTATCSSIWIMALRRW